MKKILLSVMALSSALYVSAQGISATGAYDNFETTDEIAVETPAGSGVYKGIFWWQDQDAATPFETEYTRSGNGVLVYEINQAAKAYEPIGVGFGEHGDPLEPFTLDLSGNANVSFTFKNTSNETVEFKVAIQDVNGIQLGFDKALGTPDGTLYEYEIGATSTNGLGADGINAVDPGETVDFSYDFKNALAAEYTANPNSLYGCNDLPQWQADCDGGTCFDYTKVKQMTITVVNNSSGDDPNYGTPEECYTKTEFNGTIELSEVVIGDKVLGIFASNNNELKSAVHPNPATSTLYFGNGRTLNNISVYNASGILVETLSSATELNVSSYNPGVYFINSTEGSTRFVVK